MKSRKTWASKGVREGKGKTMYGGFQQIMVTVFALLLFILPLYVRAGTITVPGDYYSIQEAIDNAGEGDEVVVSPGTYHENIDFKGKNITVRSTDPSTTSVVESTILAYPYPSEEVPMVTFSGTEGASCALKGFTITDAAYFSNVSLIEGAGTQATISHNIIEENVYNYLQSKGIHDCDGIIAHNLIKNNQGTDGTAFQGCDGIIRHNTIIENNVKYAYSLFFDCDADISHNTIAHNTGGSGYLIALSQGTIENNTIMNNDGTALYHCHGIIKGNTIQNNNGMAMFLCSGTIRENLIMGNSGNTAGGLNACSGEIANNIIVYNSATVSGGGLYNCEGLIENNVIAFNSAKRDGGGIFLCPGTLLNNVVYENTAGEKGGGLAKCTGLIANCVVWGNTAPEGEQCFTVSVPFYSCVQDYADAAPGLVTLDPGFVDPSSLDFHLTAGSPCIDAGYTSYLYGEYLADIDGEKRIAGASIDIGVDEYASSLDSDGDLLADSEETGYATQHDNRDSDGDGLIDGIEVMRGTNPALFDSPAGIVVPTDVASVQQALFYAFPAETLTVAQGTYKENLHMMGKNVTLQGADYEDKKVVSETVIDGGAHGSVITMDGSEDQTCIIQGLTITNGFALYGGGINGHDSAAAIRYNYIIDNHTFNDGAGIYMIKGAIMHNMIANNIAGEMGGGVSHCDGAVEKNMISRNFATYGGGGLMICDGAIRSNTIQDNSAGTGGGIAMSNGLIEKNILIRNVVEGSGGGIYWASDKKLYPDGQIVNNVIAHNTAYSGGGISESHSGVVNDTIYGNSAVEGGGLFGCIDTIVNCILYDNTASTCSQVMNCATPSFSCIKDWLGEGTGNISDDPLLVDPVLGDFHLSADSPCIDAGGSTPLTLDFENDPRPFDGTSVPRGDGSDIDIGADEYVGVVPTPTPAPYYYDFDTGKQGWVFHGKVGTFDPATGKWENGCLCLSAGGSSNAFSYWSSPAVTITDGTLYRATWQVGSSVSDADKAVQFRLRVNQRGSWQAWERIVNSFKQQAPCALQAKSYDVFFNPLVTGTDDDDIVLSFDILSFETNDDTSSWLYLDSVNIEEVSLSP